MALEVGQLQTIGKRVLTPFFRVAWRVTTEGLENLPDGGAILAPNHISVLDSFFVPYVLPRPITYVGKAEYLDDWKTAKLFPALGMIPIDRSGGDSAKAALDKAAEILADGRLFGIYPEGTRSRNGKLHKGHTGAARLALRTGCPIVPVGIIGTDLVQPPDTKFPRPFRNVHIRFGEPIAVERYAGRPDDHMVLRQLTDELLWEIRNLTGQEYVPTYATKPSRAAQPAPSTSTSAVQSPEGTPPTVTTVGAEQSLEAKLVTSIPGERANSAQAIRVRPLIPAPPVPASDPTDDDRQSSASVIQIRPL